MWKEITAAVRRGCEPAGLDLLQPFPVAAYNEVVPEAYWLPDFGRPGALGLLIGNTRALWPRFLAALRETPGLREDPNPLDAYAAACVAAALRVVHQRYEIRWAYDAPPRRVAMQRLAHVSGLAFLSPTYLCIHPQYGPWIALRAAVVVDVDGPTATAESTNACTGCETRCVPALRHAVASAGAGPTTQARIAQDMAAWVAVRDACSVGREYRYSEDQIRYHYTKDRGVLTRALGR